LDDRGIIATIRRASSDLGDEATNYRLRFVEGVPPLIRPRPPVETDQVRWRSPDYTPRDKETLPGGRSTDFTTPVVKKPIPQETAVQETVLQEPASLGSNTEYAMNNNNSDLIDQNTSVVVASLSSAQAWIATSPQTNTDTEELPAAAFVKEDPIPPIPGDPPSPVDAAAEKSAQELIALGIIKPVAHQLATQYSAERITEKIAYLRYLQEELPESVKHPTGWLRRAIERNYMAPEGYTSAADRAAEQYREQLSHIMENQRQWQKAEQDRQEQAEAALLAQLQATYGTTQREIDLWNELLAQFKLSLPPATFSGYVENTLLLSLQDGQALIGLPNRYARDWVENRLTRRIERDLSSCLGGQPITVTFVDLAPALS
jgi:hypothetical protein